MTTAQVVETSVTVTNSSFQNYTHPDDHTTQTRAFGNKNGPLFLGFLRHKYMFWLLKRDAKNP